jgi:hypothetical protein
VKLNKIPIDPQTLNNADTTDPTTWGTFEQCVAALPVALEEWEQAGYYWPPKEGEPAPPTKYRGGGLGFVFTENDPYAGIDRDHCVDRDTAAIEPWAQAHIDRLNSYTEITPSGTGVHTLVQGDLPPKGRKKGPVEMYAYARFFTMTGWHVPGTPRTIEQRQDELTAFHRAIFGTPQGTHQHGPAPQAASTPLLDDAVLLDKARAAKKGVGAKFSTLFAGDWSGYPSQSEADLALCIRLAFWTQDATQIDRLFRQSGLMRDKWDEERVDETYGERTIAEALARQTEHYAPRHRTGVLMTGAVQHAQYGPDMTRNGSTAAPAPSSTGGKAIRATIRLDTELSRWTDEGEAALRTLTKKVNGAPILYQRARRIALIATGVKPPRWLHRPPDAPVIIEANSDALYELAAMAAIWQKWDKRDKEWVTMLPPKLFVSTLLGRHLWPFPPLEGIICSPTLRPDGSLLATPGYDPDTGLYFDSNGTSYPPIPDNPDIFDAQVALAALKDVLCDFLWAYSYDRSAALAAILSGVCRYTVVGNVPLFGITATARGFWERRPLKQSRCTSFFWRQETTCST